MISNFKAVILAGGSGERFWPLSTPQRPKQFLRIFDEESLIQKSVSRLKGMVRPRDIYVVTAKHLVAATRRELKGIPSANIVGEPMRRDTGAAVALGVGIAGGKDDTVLAYFPADALVKDVKAFQRTLTAAVAMSREEGKMVTLGLKPTFPATGYGYIDPKGGRFVEKPDLAHARAYIKKGFLWNAGMFIARRSTFEAAIRTYAKDLSPLLAPLPARKLKKVYEGLPRISFDFAVMEKLPRVAVAPGDFGWDDVGSFAAFEKHFPQDKDGNITLGEVKSVESANVTAIQKGAAISLLGVKDVVVVTTPTNVLVVAKSALGGMKKLFQ